MEKYFKTEGAFYDSIVNHFLKNVSLWAIFEAVVGFYALWAGKMFKSWK